MNLRRRAQKVIEGVRHVAPSWTEFYTLLPCRLGYIVWDEAKCAPIPDVGGSARIFSYIEALKYATTAPRQTCGWDTINTVSL